MSPRPTVNFNLDAFKNELAAESEKKEQKVGERVLFSDKFTVGEACSYVLIGLVACGMLRYMSTLGLTMDMIVVVIVVSTIWEVTIAPRKIKYGERVLKIRKLKQTGAEMEQKNKKFENPWKDEDNKFGIHVADHIDYAVMKYIGDDVPHVVEQEYQHAKMHHAAQADAKQEKEHMEWLVKTEPILNFYRKIFLRRGDRFGTLLCGMAEAANIYGLFLQSLCASATGNVMSFHLFEECEHASVTVQSLKKKTTAIERVLLFPFWMALYFLLLLAMPVKLLEEPSLLLKPMTYVYFLSAMFTASVAVVGMQVSVFVHWVLPVPVPQSLVTMAKGYFREQCETGGVEWEVTKQATYPLYL